MESQGFTYGDLKGTVRTVVALFNEHNLNDEVRTALDLKAAAVWEIIKDDECACDLGWAKDRVHHPDSTPMSPHAQEEFVKLLIILHVARKYLTSRRLTA